MSQTYHYLARRYDELQQDVDPVAWADYIQKIEQKFSKRHGGDGQEGRPLLLDLGCGTGSFCLEMAVRGYDPIGIDTSSAMLDEARRKQDERSGLAGADRCLFLQQDISRFELFGTVDLAVCLLDTVNHLIHPAQVRRLFKLCANYLNPGSLLIFDLATRRHLAETLGSQFFFQDRPDATLFWQNSFRSASGISRSELTLFQKRDDGGYDRLDETIVEKYYDECDIEGWLSESGLQPVARLGDFTFRKPAAAAERQFFVARKPISQQKR